MIRPDGPRVRLVRQADGCDSRPRGAIDAVRARRDRGRIQPPVERQPGEDHELVHGIEAFDVTGRIGLGITEPLSLGERGRVVERRSVVGHRTQDEVRRPVDDAPDAGDPVCREVTSEWPEDRDTATDRGFEAQRGARPPGDGLELGSVMSDHVLVGRDDRLPHRERGGDQRVGRFVAAHELDDRIDLVVGDEMRRRIGQHRCRQARARGAVHITHGDRGDLERSAIRGTHLGGPVKEGANDLSADGPCPKHPDAQGRARHRLGRFGRDIRRMVADPPREPPTGLTAQ